MAVMRYCKNPIITPSDIKPSRPDYEVVCAFNAGVARYGDEVILLLRIAERPINNNPEVYLSPVFDSEEKKLIIKSFDRNNKQCDFSDSRVIRTAEGMHLTSISHLRAAKSRGGVCFEIDENPALFPSNTYEMYGIEDPRITLLGDTYYINYSAISAFGITTCLASTKDFEDFKRHGIIFCPDNKDVAIFPEKINNRYYAINRPESGIIGCKDIWISESYDLMNWGNHRRLMGTREGDWDNGRVGSSAVPFRVREGWLEIYHGATRENRYCLGAVLLDAEEPWKIIARSRRPILEPETDYELNGFFGNVVFSCGALYEENLVKLYYGAADTCMAYAEIPLEDIFETME